MKPTSCCYGRIRLEEKIRKIALDELVNACEDWVHGVEKTRQHN